jgi:hypothetical protein
MPKHFAAPLIFILHDPEVRQRFSQIHFQDFCEARIANYIQVSPGKQRVGQPALGADHMTDVSNADAPPKSNLDLHTPRSYFR